MNVSLLEHIQLETIADFTHCQSVKFTDEPLDHSSTETLGRAVRMSVMPFHPGLLVF